MLPVFATGFEFETALAGGAAPGQSAFAITGASVHLAPGDLIFLSEGDGADPEFLGPAVAVEENALVTAYAVQRAKAAGARLWSPEHAFLFTAAPEPPIRRPIETGVETLITVGGRVVQTRIGAPLLREELIVRGLSRAAHAALMAWLDAATEWGLRPFHYVDAERQVRRARLAEPPLPCAETAPGQFAITLALLIIE